MIYKLIYYFLRDWECSNVISNEIIVTGHGNPDTHKTTFLYRVNLITKTRIPILHQWCKDNKAGLEDPYWLKNINGYDWLWAERKDWYGSQVNISFFRAEAGTDNWKWICDINPISSVSGQSYSVSSPTFIYSGGKFKGLYEGRYKSNIQNYKTWYIEIDPNTLIIKRPHIPIMEDRAVPDHINNSFDRISIHRQGTATQYVKYDKWHAVVYKLVNGIWKEDYDPKDQDGRVGEFYFNNFYWKNNANGLWKFVNDSSPNPNPIPEEDAMDVKLKATDIGNGEIMLSWEHPENVNNVHLQDNIRGYFATVDKMKSGTITFKNNVGATKWSARPSNEGMWQEWVSLEVNEEVEPDPTPDPDPDPDTAIAKELIEDELYTIKNSINKIQEIMDTKL